MQHYYGAKVIAERLNISQGTLNRWIDTLGLPVYLRVDKRCKYRRMLYTNDDLLGAWERSMCSDYRQRRISGKVVNGPQVVIRPSSEEIKRRKKRNYDTIVDYGAICAENPEVSAH